MTFKTALLGMAACAALLAPSAANAVTGSIVAGPTGPFSSLSAAGLDGGATATLTGGTVYVADMPFADIPAGAVYENKFLAAGPTASEPATLAFTSGVSLLSFLWGSPDLYNRLQVTTNLGATLFTANSLGFPSTGGDQNWSTYVAFTAAAGETIQGLTFFNSPSQDAFEVANFSITGVPEPVTWAMMLVGFAGIGCALRRRRLAPLAA